MVKFQLFFLLILTPGYTSSLTYPSKTGPDSMIIAVGNNVEYVLLSLCTPNAEITQPKQVRFSNTLLLYILRFRTSFGLGSNNQRIVGISERKCKGIWGYYAILEHLIINAETLQTFC